MTGALRAVFNALYDPLQGFSICTTGQLLILQLIHDLQKIPTLEMVSANTDAVMFTIEEEHKPLAIEVLDAWQRHTKLELEEDRIVKIIMRDVNNYCEIVQVGDNDYEVHYKGGEFKGIHNFKWNKEKKIFEYSFDDDIEANSLTIVSEALLKNLLFDIPIEDTINNCDDIFRFQMITHLGHTYEKMVQESPTGDVELQRNNRVYAGKKPSGLIVKVKPNGRRDSLANCPPNPIVDNANKCNIEDINKAWYIDYAKLKLNDFKGVKRMEDYKKTELLDMIQNMNIDIAEDAIKKMKKADLIELIKANEDNINKKENMEMEKKKGNTETNLLQKINNMKIQIANMNFVMDCNMPSNLGGREYPSIGQYYKTIQDLSISNGLMFQWEVRDVESLERDAFKPTGKMPSHISTVRCVASFHDVDNVVINEDGGINCPTISYVTYASGSDICDKGISGASALAFRNWFDKNFTPSYLTIDEFTGEVNLGDTVVTNENQQTNEPKVPIFIPQDKKQEIVNNVVNTIQQEPSDEQEIKEVVNKIMTVRSLLGNDEWGKKTLETLMSGAISTPELMSVRLTVENKLESLQPNPEAK